MRAKGDSLKGTLIPADIGVAVTRDYGATASEKSNELLLHMGIAVFGVAVSDDFDPRADVFSIYVEGLSDYSFNAPPATVGSKPVVTHKTSRIDFRRRAAEYNSRSK